ncbi:MAG: hypothetical protein IPL94_08175 [Tetrasphaera sp.]|nr:hypothetical protein [Tetrasphaera sp.]
MVGTPHLVRMAGISASFGRQRGVLGYHDIGVGILECMRTLRRRHTRRSHHPMVTHDALGRWHWTCGCGAGGRSGASAADWHWALTAALVHQSVTPSE